MRTKGTQYRPRVTILKTKKGVPTVIWVSGRRYVLLHEDTKKIGGYALKTVEVKHLLENNINAQLIVAGMVGLIDEGRTFHEMMEVLEAIKRETFPAMMQIARGEESE